jgi:hypothetical protein
VQADLLQELIYIYTLVYKITDKIRMLWSERARLDFVDAGE